MLCRMNILLLGKVLFFHFDTIFIEMDAKIIKYLLNTSNMEQIYLLFEIPSHKCMYVTDLKIIIINFLLL
jgi:hypothetical protein